MYINAKLHKIDYGTSKYLYEVEDTEFKEIIAIPFEDIQLAADTKNYTASTIRIILPVYSSKTQNISIILYHLYAKWANNKSSAMFNISLHDREWFKQYFPELNFNKYYPCLVRQIQKNKFLGKIE